MKSNLWKLLHVFESKVRIEIVRLLLQFEMMTLSDIANKLKGIHGREMTLPGVLKHVRGLEEIGIVRQESGLYLPKPDARKTIYLLEGKERVQQVLQKLESAVSTLLQSGVVFHETARLARRVQLTPRISEKDRKRLETLLARCESEEINRHLTDDERKKVKFWRMIFTKKDGTYF